MWKNLTYLGNLILFIHSLQALETAFRDDEYVGGWFLTGVENMPYLGISIAFIDAQALLLSSDDKNVRYSASGWVGPLSMVKFIPQIWHLAFAKSIQLH